MNLKLKKAEFIIFFLILLAAIGSWLYVRKVKSSRDYGSFRITAFGEDLGTYSLGVNQKIKILSTNICEVKDGQVKMIEATCPDHLCMSQLPIDEKGGLIICLPNQVVIEGIPSESAASELELDGITG